MPNATTIITESNLEEYRSFLVSKGLSKATIENYLYNARIFVNFLKNREITPELLESFKEKQLKKFTVVGAKALICGVNSYLDYIGYPYKITQVKVHKQKKKASQAALTKSEYLEMLKAIKHSGNDRLYLIVESICGAGLKLSELNYLTVEAVIKGKVELPSNNHSVYLSKNLCSDLLDYCKDRDIIMGAILVTRSGRVPDRANVSRDIKAVCADTGIDPEKLSTKALREYYFQNLEGYRSEVVEMMDREWREPKKAI